MYYWVRRLLKFSRKKWDKLPWHDQDLYLKGMIAEMQARAEAAGGGSGGAPGTTTTTYDLSNGGGEAMAGYQAMGIQVEQI